jgi:hypothetical protein
MSKKVKILSNADGWAQSSSLRQRCSFLQLAGTAERLNLTVSGGCFFGSGGLREKPLDGRTQLLPRVALVQGVFYLLTGVWPIVDIDSFQSVTGPKNDLWLVRTVGALIAVIGAVLISAGGRRRVTDELVLLGVGSALALTTIDVVYVLSDRISEIYLADAAAEIALAALWGIGRLRR